MEKSDLNLKLKNKKIQYITLDGDSEEEWITKYKFAKLAYEDDYFSEKTKKRILKEIIKYEKKIKKLGITVDITKHPFDLY